MLEGLGCKNAVQGVGSVDTMGLAGHSHSALTHGCGRHTPVGLAYLSIVHWPLGLRLCLIEACIVVTLFESSKSPFLPGVVVHISNPSTLPG